MHPSPPPPMTTTTTMASQVMTDSTILYVSTWYHRAWLAIGCISSLISLAKSISLAGPSSSTPKAWLELTTSYLAGYVMADFGTGIYHWAIDNYGSAQTPIVGEVIEAFQVHHQIPWAITTRPVAFNLHVLAQGMTFVVLPTALICDDYGILGFLGVFGGCVIFCQQFHAWSHAAKPALPWLVVALQDSGVIVSRAQHAKHHHPPYNSNYCIVSGMWNSFLDATRFFVGLEVVLFYTLGVRPRSWTEPDQTQQM